MSETKPTPITNEQVLEWLFSQKGRTYVAATLGSLGIRPEKVDGERFATVMREMMQSIAIEGFATEEPDGGNELT